MFSSLLFGSIGLDVLEAMDVAQAWGWEERAQRALKELGLWAKRDRQASGGATCLTLLV